MQEIKPCQPVHATLTLPGSKSYTHRALMAAALAAGESVLTNALTAEDTELTAQALAQLGAGIDWQGTTIRVTGRGGRWRPVAEPIYLGNSGTSMRFLTALAALGAGRVPPHRHRAPLPAPPGGAAGRPWARLGVQAASERGDGCPPVTGHRRPHRRPGPALRAPSAASTSRPCSSSGPWRPQGVEIEHHRRTGLPALRGPDPGGAGRLRHLLLPGRLPLFSSSPAARCYLPQDYEIEADASSASYFWAAAALTGGRVTITNLSLESSQGDAAFPGVLERHGLHRRIHPGGADGSGRTAQGVTVDMATMPDLVPTLAVLAAFAQGETVITGVAHLRHKESDRLAAVATELEQAGDRGPGNRRRPDHPGRHAPGRRHRHLSTTTASP